MNLVRSMRWTLFVAVFVTVAGASSLTVAADDPSARTTTSAAITPADAKPPADTVNTGDNAWVLVSSALVLMMTGPGLALFYSGLVRKKNVLSVMMQCVFLMCLMTVIWALYGFTLAFGGDGPWIGGPSRRQPP